jgi:hypothetical protein
LISYASGKTIHQFLSSGTFTVTNPGLSSVDYLVVAGGGGGGQKHLMLEAGAGGFRTGTGLPVSFLLVLIQLLLVLVVLVVLVEVVV